MTEKIRQSNVLELWAKNCPEVERWLSHLQKKAASAFTLYRFCEYVKKTPTELLDLKKRDPTANVVEKILDDFCSGGNASFVNSFKFHGSIAVKSFFKWNYTDLAKACGAVTLEKKKPYNKLSKELLRKLWSRTLNMRDRAIIPFVTSTAIAKETLSSLTWGLLEQGWEAKEIPCIEIPPELLKGHGRGRYKDVKQITFLTPEAKRELLNYKEWVESRLGRKVGADDHVWLDTRGNYEPLIYESFGSLISRLAREAGVKFTWHDGRRWVNTALEQIGISPNWARKIRGRKVKGEEAPYSQPAVEQLRAKFREAVPLLEFITEASTVSKEVEERLKALENFKKDLTPEQLEKAKRAGILMRKTKNVSAPKDEMCTDGKHCGEDDFKQISETELLQYLKGGWNIAYKLASGEVIVRRT